MKPEHLLKTVLLLSFFGINFSEGHPGRNYPIGILGDCPAAEQSLQKAGYSLSGITWDDFLNGSVSVQRFSCLLFAQSRRFPYAARQCLLQYLKSGGDLIILSGPAFEIPVYPYGGGWYSQEELLPRLAADAEDRRISVDFANEDPQRWTRDADNLNLPSTLTKKEEKGLFYFQADIQHFSRWDTFRGPFRSSPGHNVLWLKAKGSDNLRQMVVEIREDDGSRWVAVANLPHQWQEIALLQTDFQFLSDGSPHGRGGPEDCLAIEKAAWLQFGMSYDFSPHAAADYQICIQQAGTAKIELPDGFGKPLFEKVLPVFSIQPFHQYTDAVCVRPVPSQPFTASQTAMKMPLKGTSAIGFPYVNESKYIGILEVLDSIDRPRGFAAGILLHYGGPYKGGQWLLFGVQNELFYQTEFFTECLLQIVEKMQEPSLLKQLAQAEIDARSKRQPRPKSRLQPIRRSTDGKHLVYTDGSPFFMLGVNYIGSFDCKTTHASSNFFYDKWETDFRKARDAGINCIRLWIEGLDGDKAKLDSILYLADKYGIYLLLHPTAHPAENGEELTELFTKLAELAAEEPAVLGYDLMNEPYITTVGSIRIGGRPSAIIRHDPYNTYIAKGLYDLDWVNSRVQHGSTWPPLSSWSKDAQAQALLAAYNILSQYSSRCIAPRDYSSLYGISGPLPITEELAPFFGAVNQTFADWLNLHIPAIRSRHPSALITVGYNTILTALPANQQLDFVSHHLYQPPTSFEDIQKAVTTFDRLQKLWPDKPITLGEFGISCGTQLPDGSTMDIYNAAVNEILIWLYAWVNGFDGAMSWMISDWPVALMDYSAPWISKNRRSYEAGFGMYFYDGTETGQAKPIVGAVQTLRQYLDLCPPSKGNLRLVPSPELQSGCGYLYHNQNALFVGAKTFQNEHLRFHSPQAANLFLYWNGKEMRILSTADGELSIQNSFLQSILGAGPWKFRGRVKTPRQTETGWLLNLFENQPCWFITQ
jgi:hypothetical protein